MRERVMQKNSEYEKIPKTLKQLGLTEKALHALGKGQWVVTEKIHGANFSFAYENQKLLFAKRKAYLGWHDDFFGFQEVVSRLEDRVLALFERLSLDVAADRYVLYGELFGGHYPHPGVPAHPGVAAIQTGVYYAPGIHFCAFDLAFEAGEKKHYLDYATAIRYFEAFDIFYARVLLAGKLNEALDFNLRINSTVPALLLLPALDANLIEGVVIKPLHHSELKNGEPRPILKLKNAEFDEEKKFHEAEKWSFIPRVSSKSETLSFILDEIAGYINANRVNSALSKNGRLDLGNPARLQTIREEVLADVWADFNGNHDQLLDDLSADEQDWLRNRMKALINGQLNRL
ncbi:MAG: 2'-5' RNA ligase [Cytophagales bacterium]|nr:2'-5' RNA ligase [Cytophagales bacterium]